MSVALFIVPRVAVTAFISNTKNAKSYAIKIAALATRADIVAHQDFYLCPLSAKQVSAEDLDRLLAPVWRGEQPLADVRLSAEGHADDQAEPEAVGFAS